MDYSHWAKYQGYQRIFEFTPMETPKFTGWTTSRKLLNPRSSTFDNFWFRKWEEWIDENLKTKQDLLGVGCGKWKYKFDKIKDGALIARTCERLYVKYQPNRLIKSYTEGMKTSFEILDIWSNAHTKKEELMLLPNRKQQHDTIWSWVL